MLNFDRWVNLTLTGDFLTCTSGVAFPARSSGTVSMTVSAQESITMMSGACCTSKWGPPDTDFEMHSMSVPAAWGCLLYLKCCMDLIAPPLCVRCRLGIVIELADLNLEVSEKQPDIDIEIHSVSVSGCLGLSVVISYMLHVTGTCVFLSCPSRAEAEPDWPLYERLGVIIVGCHSLLPTLYEHQMLVWGPPAGYRHRDALNVGSRLLGVVCGFMRQLDKCVEYSYTSFVIGVLCLLLCVW